MSIDVTCLHLGIDDVRLLAEGTDVEKADGWVGALRLQAHEQMLQHLRVLEQHLAGILVVVLVLDEPSNLPYLDVVLDALPEDLLILVWPRGKDRLEFIEDVGIFGLCNPRLDHDLFKSWAHGALMYIYQMLVSVVASVVRNNIVVRAWLDEGSCDPDIAVELGV